MGKLKILFWSDPNSTIHYDLFLDAHRELINEVIESNHNTRQREGTESIAVGSEQFTQEIKKKLASRTKGRTIIKIDSGTCQLREANVVYADNFDYKIEHTGKQTIIFGISMSEFSQRA